MLTCRKTQTLTSGNVDLKMLAVSKFYLKITTKQNDIFFQANGGNFTKQFYRVIKSLVCLAMFLQSLPPFHFDKHERIVYTKLQKISLKKRPYL